MGFIIESSDTFLNKTNQFIEQMAFKKIIINNKFHTFYATLKVRKIEPLVLLFVCFFEFVIRTFTTTTTTTNLKKNIIFEDDKLTVAFLCRQLQSSLF